MVSLEKIKSTLSHQKSKLRASFNIKNLGIFGSFVRGEQKKGSDLDVLVEFAEPIGLFRFIELEELLTEMLGVKVDLVSKKALKPRIGERILKEVVYV